MDESFEQWKQQIEERVQLKLSQREARQALIAIFIDDLLAGGGVTAEPFRTPDGQPFVRVQVDEHWEHLSLAEKKTGALKLWIKRLFWQAHHSTLKPAELREVTDRLEAAARFDNHIAPVALRTAEHGGRFYFQLDKQRTVEISTNGWSVVHDPPVRFIWHEGMMGLPGPVRGGDVAQLFELINVANEDDRILLLTWLLMAMNPVGPYPILALHGVQGSAKTTTARILQNLIDPSRGDLNSAPPTERDLMIRLSKSHLLGFDNLSKMPGWLSDALCRVSTGAGYTRRVLYSDDNEVFFGGRRPALFNGIPEIATRGDLLDRMIGLHLPLIPESQRKLDSEVKARFEELRPSIMGGLFDALVGTARNLPSVRLATSPRMADFARFGCAAEIALGFKSGTFLSAYERNLSEVHFLALDGNPFALELFRWRCGEWVGTVGELLAILTSQRTVKDPDWPKTARAAAAILRRTESNLRAAGKPFGFEITYLRREAGTGRRLIRIRNGEAKIVTPQHVTPQPVNGKAVILDSDDVTKSVRKDTEVFDVGAMKLVKARLKGNQTVAPELLEQYQRWEGAQ